MDREREYRTIKKIHLGNKYLLSRLPFYFTISRPPPSTFLYKLPTFLDGVVVEGVEGKHPHFDQSENFEKNSSLRCQSEFFGDLAGGAPEAPVSLNTLNNNF